MKEVKGMKYTDHFALGRFVIDMYEIDNKLQRAMFIWGNVIPRSEERR